MKIDEKEKEIKINSLFTLKINNDENKYKKGECAKEILKYAFPSIVSALIIYSMETINLIFVSKTEIKNPDITKIELIEAIGIGNIYMNFFGFLFGLGMINSLETLCSKEFGRFNLRQLSKWGKISFYLMTFYFIFLASVSLNSESIIFHTLIQEKRISYIASQYIYYLIPSFLMQFYLNIITKILNSQKIYYSVLLINSLCLLTHPFWCWIFFTKFEFYFHGLSIAYGITSFLLLISLWNYSTTNDYYLDISWNEISNEEILEFMRISFECGILCSVDTLGFEIVSILSSHLPTIQRTANITIINIYNNIYSISTGFSTCITTLVAHKIGKDNLEEAEKVSKIGLGLNFILNIFIASICIIFHDMIANFYLSDFRVLSLTSNLIKIVGIFIIFDGMQIQISGILRGIGKQYQAMIIGFFIFIFLQSYLAYYFAFPLKMKIWGIWIGLLISSCFGFIIYLVYLKICFDELSREFYDLILNEENIFEDKISYKKDYMEKVLIIN
jgi:MATE family multidrug resistance protein